MSGLSRHRFCHYVVRKACRSSTYLRVCSEEKIIERADKKLFLDAAVIQQGRLAEQNS